MATIARKRLRSDESPCLAIQTKIHINQRIVDQNDGNKMKEIHAKTVRQLFDAARRASYDTENIKTPSLPLCQQIILSGDGRIAFRNFPFDLPVERHKSKCCAVGESFVQERCVSCSFDLCENCGYSCSDCGCFLCRSCVALFGCGTTERPICEKCAIFN